MTKRSTHPRRSRAWSALALVALIGSSMTMTPQPAAARALAADAADTAPDLVSAASTDEPQLRSIHYEQAMEHAADELEFEPGGRVTVPFSPRAGDRFEVDGRAPRALPAGHATGVQMRAAPANAMWSAGPPADLAMGPHAGIVAGPAAGVARGTQADNAAPHHADVDVATHADNAAKVEPASFTGPFTADETAAAAPIGSSGLRREVFGFLPYWEVSDPSTTLDWKTLSTVAYFSVGCLSSGYLDKYDPDGSTTTGWGGWTSSKMTSIINAAHQNQTRVVLTISCFAWSSSGASRQASVLGSATARTRLAKAAAAAVRDRGADGINLDFEPIVAGYADEFTALVRSVRTELNRIAPGYQLTFDTLGSIGNQPIADATAPGGADAVFVMGYDYRTDGSSVAGSISPLAGPKYDLTDTVKAYTSRISPSKVILGVPYYGRAWSTSSDRLNASTVSGAKYGYPASPSYSQAIDIVADYGRRWDSVEQAPWTAYRKQTCTSTYGCVTSWRELYYDDSASLRLRYDLVNRTSLRGAGIWALGYDGTRPDLRNALADKFLSDRTAPITGVTTLGETQRDEGFRVAWTSWDSSTIKGYDVQVSIDGGTWAPWLTGTTLRSSIYLGTNGRTYAFRIRATDVHGNVTPWNSSVTVGDLTVPAAIKVGGFAKVVIDGLRMRSAASTGASIMTTLSVGDALRVIGGPASGEGYTWYQVAGPVRQWGPVDAMQVGGWIAASGNGVTNARSRRPVYATRLDAGITGLKLNGGGERAITPNGDGSQDKLHLSWTNHRSFDSFKLRVFRANGTLAGSVTLGGTGSGTHGYNWDGRVGGALLPPGTYVIQLQGMDGGIPYSAPSGSPVSPAQVGRFGVILGPAAPTHVLSFTSSPASPTKATTITYTVKFGGGVKWLLVDDFTRSGTATNCHIGKPVGSAATWTVTLTGCSAGTVLLKLRAKAVQDAVGNWGPSSQVNAPNLVIDRSAPHAATPKVSLRAGVNLPSTSTSAGVLANVALSATDPGGAGIRSYDVRRSVDGAAYQSVGAGLTAPTLAMTLVPGHGYRFSVRARDRAGNVGDWVAGPVIRAYLPQQTSAALTWRGAWSKGASAGYSGGTDRFATAAGASVSYGFTGRGIGWVTTLGADRGAAKVYLDGVLVATLDTHATALSFRRVVFVRTWATSGFHTLRIVVVGTTGHPRIDVDALEVLR